MRRFVYPDRTATDTREKDTMADPTQGPTQWRENQAAASTAAPTAAPSALIEKSKDELLATAEALGVEVNSSSSKAKIAEAIERAGE